MTNPTKDPKIEKARVAMVIVAAGEGSRFGSTLPKQYQRLANKPLLSYSLEIASNHPLIDLVVCVIQKGHEEYYQEACERLASRPVKVLGKSTRQGSVRAALEFLAEHENRPDLILIHDGARPFLHGAMIVRLLEVTWRYGAASLAVPVNDTLKKGAFKGGLTVIEAEQSREGLWAMQTPQCFRFELLFEAHRWTDQAKNAAYTDDTSMVFAYEKQVVLIEGDQTNIKVTHPKDMELAEAMMRNAKSFETRIGTGFDIHRFTEGNQIIIGGIAIPHNCSLLGHSDADVLLHALTDAILGAIAKGDIGVHFPPDDQKWRDANSALFVEFAMDCLSELGGSIINIDAFILAEAPKLSPHYADMCQNIARLCKVSTDKVNVKATTMEKIGAIGQGEGIAAQVSVSVKLPA